MKLDSNRTTGAGTKQKCSFFPFHDQTDTGLSACHGKKYSCQRKGADSKNTLSFTKFSELQSCCGVCPAQWSPRRQYSFD